jgi:hypothetical protein
VSKLAKAWKRHAKWLHKLNESFWAGDLDCSICGRFTNNGTCTQCRYGASPLLRARRWAKWWKAAAKDQRDARKACEFELNLAYDAVVEEMQICCGLAFDYGRLQAEYDAYADQWETTLESIRARNLALDEALREGKE